jgi:dUTP pyrophosphatase
MNTIAVGETSIKSYIKSYIPLKVYKADPEAQIPTLATSGSACFDVRSCFYIGDRITCYNAWNKKVDVVAKVIGGKIALQLPPMHRALIPTGLIFDIPEDHVMKMYVRSSVALKKGLMLANGTGIIDSDYVDPCYIILQNTTESLVNIEAGERLAQCAIEPVHHVHIEQTEVKPEQKTERDGGLGSTGTK